MYFSRLSVVREKRVRFMEGRIGTQKVTGAVEARHYVEVIVSICMCLCEGEGLCVCTAKKQDVKKNKREKKLLKKTDKKI